MANTRLWRIGLGLYRSVLRLIVRRPWLLPDLIGLAWSNRARGWYRRLPFLPIPPRSYLRWRMETAYGDPDAEPTPSEVARYLSWASRMRRRR